MRKRSLRTRLHWHDPKFGAAAKLALADNPKRKSCTLVQTACKSYGEWSASGGMAFKQPITGSR